MEKVSMSYLFSFTLYQTKCVIKFLFRQLMTSRSLRFIFDQPLQQWLTGRKRWDDRNTKKFNISRKKELFRWNKKEKKIWRTIIWWETEIWQKWRTQALIKANESNEKKDPTDNNMNIIRAPGHYEQNDPFILYKFDDLQSTTADLKSEENLKKESKRDSVTIKK